MPLTDSPLLGCALASGWIVLYCPTCCLRFMPALWRLPEAAGGAHPRIWSQVLPSPKRCSCQPWDRCLGLVGRGPQRNAVPSWLGCGCGATSRFCSVCRSGCCAVRGFCGGCPAALHVGTRACRLALPPPLAVVDRAMCPAVGWWFLPCSHNTIRVSELGLRGTCPAPSTRTLVSGLELVAGGLGLP